MRTSCCSRADLSLNWVIRWRSPYGGDRREQPAELRVLGHVGLAEQDAAIGIEPGGHQHRGRVEHVARQRVGVVGDARGVQVDDAVDRRIAALLALEVAPDRPDVVAEVLAPGGLDAAEDAHGAASLRSRPPRESARPRCSRSPSGSRAARAAGCCRRLSVARDEITCSPGGASQSKRQPRQACGPRGGSRTAALKVDAVVRRDLDALDLAEARPGAAGQGDRAGLDVALARHEVRHARAGPSASAAACGVTGSPGSPSALVHPVGRRRSGSR